MSEQNLRNIALGVLGLSLIVFLLGNAFIALALFCVAMFFAIKLNKQTKKEETSGEEVPTKKHSGLMIASVAGIIVFSIILIVAVGKNIVAMTQKPQVTVIPTTVSYVPITLQFGVVPEITNKDTIVITGSTNAKTVKVNNEELVDVWSVGTFEIPAKLTLGKNELLFTFIRGDEYRESTILITYDPDFKTPTPVPTNTPEPVLSQNEIIKRKSYPVDYKLLTKNSGKYKGEYKYFKGKILQIQESGKGSSAITFIRLDVTKGYYGNDVLAVKYYNETDYVEGDIINVWGPIGEDFSYKSQAGWDITIPFMEAELIEKTR